MLVSLLCARQAAIMAWRGPLGDGGDSSLELSLGLPAYFAKPSLSSGEFACLQLVPFVFCCKRLAPSFDLWLVASGLDAAGEEPGDAAAFALQAAKGSNDGSKARLVPSICLSVPPSDRKRSNFDGCSFQSTRSRPAAAAPVVGWPPVRSFRRNLASRPSPQSSSGHRHHHHNQDGGAKDGDKGGLFVKINMDGVPIGRKVDLRAYAGYADLSAAVGKLFCGLLAAAGTCARPPRLLQQWRRRKPYCVCRHVLVHRLIKQKKMFFSIVAVQRDPAATAGSEEVQEPVIGGDYTLVYEDDEGDRVLVGDVPWE